ncbi:hypothetical protein [Ruegeria atlantica]|uniref:hypothetical protein n=1 Tax=Ruegeria atlantica TaxID=81569 RepID=UPI00147CF1CB|nr:hypothetical protein [Ruegeria atlantica]
MTDGFEMWDEFVRIVPAGKGQEEFLFDVKIPTIPVAGDRINLEVRGMMFTYLVVSRTFQILIDGIEDSEDWGRHLGPVKAIIHVEELAVDAVNLRYGPFAKKGSQ